MVNKSYVNAGSLFILGKLFSIAWSLCIGVCLVPGDVNGPFLSPWEPFLMSAYLHIRTAQREGERQAEQKEPERGSGRRNQTMPSPQGPSMMQLWLPFDTLTKEGQTYSPAKLGYFLLIPPFVGRRIKHPLKVFLVNCQSHFVTVPLFPLCPPAH